MKKRYEISMKVKFRAWDPIDNFLYPSSGVRNDGVAADFSFNGEEDVEIEPTWELDMFTGYTDVRGIEIYENDIVEVSSWARSLVGNTKPVLAYVGWSELNAGFKLYTRNSEDNDISTFTEENDYRVVGNMHENSSMLFTPTTVTRARKKKLK